MSIEELSIINGFGTLDIETSLRKLETVLLRHNVPLADFTLYGKPMNFTTVLSRLKESQRRTFDIAGQGFKFHYSSVSRNGFDHLTITSPAPSTISWDEWITEFIGNPHFIMAWVMDVEYDGWQNAEDPLIYTAAGKSYANLPMKSNGLPYPVERMIIDTSRNIGRRQFRDGYIEAVGATMWLSEPFWALTKATKEDVISQNWLKHETLANGVLRIQAADASFTSAAGTDGELQDKLRSLLFPAIVTLSSIEKG